MSKFEEKRNSRIGEIWGELEIIGWKKSKNTKKGFETICKCSCGKITTTRYDGLVSGHCKSCGHLVSETISKLGRAKTDINYYIGKKYNRLTVINIFYDIPHKGANYKNAWAECLCDCGNKINYLLCNVKSHNPDYKSCGCLHRENSSKRITALNKLPYRREQSSINGINSQKNRIPYKHLIPYTDRQGVKHLFMSSYEVRLAVMLDFFCIKWEYEKHTLTLSPTQRTLVDFYLPEFGIYIETKSQYYYDLHDYGEKLKLIREQNIPLILMLKEDIEEAEEWLKSTI